MFLPMMAVGATGVISVVTNMLPQKVKALGQAFMEKKDPGEGPFHPRGAHAALSGLFVETSPVPVKEALYCMGLMEKEVRLPLCGLSQQNRELIKGLVKEYGLLSRSE